MLVVAATVLAVGDSLSFTDISGYFHGYLSGESREGAESVDLITLDELGLAATLVASLLSGLSNALTQRSFAVAPGKEASSIPRNPFLYSIELAVYGLAFLCATEIYEYYQHGDGLFASTGRFMAGWTPYTMIPVTMNACGGIVVGLVVKYAGGIAKGFALIVGIILTGIVSYMVENKPLSSNTG